ncbi:MAG: hypothetical protein V4581_10395 [Bacteroidota bacterium]
MRFRLKILLFSIVFVSFNCVAQGTIKTITTGVGKISTYSGKCLTGAGICSQPLSSYPYAYDTLDITSTTAFVAVNNGMGGGTILVDIINSKEVRLWVSDDIEGTGLTYDDFSTFEICTINFSEEKIQLKSGVYSREVEGKYFTYIVPYTTL